MLTTGDLVRIKDDAFKYFAGKLAVVDHTAFREEYFDIDGKLHHRTYVFAEHDLTIVSKAYERND